jgi:tRNA nucleotidyltransferase/poly(A) polymerase
MEEGSSLGGAWEVKMLNRLLDVFKSFQYHDVRYVVIGGIATILHGVPRATFDLDILIEATPENVTKLLDALLDAGLATAALTSVNDVLQNEITIFKDRVRIDVQTFTPGIDFKTAIPAALFGKPAHSHRKAFCMRRSTTCTVANYVIPDLKSCIA